MFEMSLVFVRDERNLYRSLSVKRVNRTITPSNGTRFGKRKSLA